MHRDFAAWYRFASIEPDGALLTKRWAAVERLAEEPSGDDVLALCRIALGLYAPADDPYAQTLMDEFQKDDPAFERLATGVELSVLAGAILMTHLEGDSSTTGDLLALALVAADCFGARSIDRPKTPVLAAAAYLAAERARLRQRPADAQRPALKPVKFDNAAVAANPGGQIPTELEKLAKQATQISQVFTGEIDIIARRVDLLQEESDCLWWLIAQYSADLSVPLKETEPRFLPLLIGKELADRIRIVPGPLAAGALLSRALSGQKRTRSQLIDAITLAPPAWKQKLGQRLDGEVPHLLCPILSALLKSTEPGFDQPTLGKWMQEVLQIEATKKVDPHDLALQTFHEMMVIKAREEA